MNPLHYPSLELCKKLTEAGFPRTEYQYEKNNNKRSQAFWDIKFWNNWYSYLSNDWLLEAVCPSVMELLDELPWFIETEDWICRLILRKERWWENWYYDKNNSAMIFNDNLPNSLAEMWLWLKEDDLLPKK